MGCDIHVRAEFYGPIETIVQTDDGMAVATEEAWCWQPAEPLTPNETLVSAKKLLEKGSIGQETYEAWVSEEPTLALARQDRVYTGRDYGFFGKLSGVRSGDFDPLVGLGHPRFERLPEDVSPEVEEELSLDDSDLHSHGWMTLAELQQADWEDFEGFLARYDAGRPRSQDPHRRLMTALEAIAIEKCKGEPTRVRALWAYDN